VKTTAVRLLAAERIKLTSTPSLWWCGGIAVALVVGMMGLAVAIESDLGRVSEAVPYLARLGYPVVLVLAAVAVTGEYRHGTLRTTFVAVPRRTMVLLAKTAVVAIGASALGLAAAFGSWALALLVARGADAALDTPADWRAVAGVGLAYAVVAVIGVGVGLLVRHGAGAVTLLLCWLLAEIVAGSVATTSEYLSPWLPFTVLNRFTSAELAGPNPGQSIFVEQSMFGPWAALAYAAGVALAVLAAAVAATRRRDA
jgi:ABC-2 type transport system permease protein